MATVSVFRNTTSNESIISSPEAVINSIIDGTFQEFITYLRSLNKAEYDAEKKTLTAVTWSGTFKEGTRKKETLTSYSNLVVIDIDNLDESTIPTLKGQLSQDEYVRYCFVSPSGKGIKIVIQVNTGQDKHRAAFLHLQNYFETKYLIKVDKSGKDECRLCYLSHDPYAIINNQSKVFEVDVKYDDVINEYTQSNFTGADINSLETMFKVCIKWIEKNHTYQEGERNVFIHSLACALNRVGMSQENAFLYISNSYDLDKKEIIQAVRSAYYHNQHEHGNTKLKEIGNSTFTPAPQIQMSDDIVINDIMNVTAGLYYYKVPNDYIFNIVTKVAQFYDSKGYLEFSRYSLGDIMNTAVAKLQENMANTAQQFTLAYKTAEDMLNDILSTGGNENCISTGFIEFDSEMFGGMQLGNAYGVIGMGESYKSVLAQRICFMNAIKGVPSVYLNGEMSSFQFYERLVCMAFGIDLRAAIGSGQITKENAASFIEQVKQVTNNNIFVFNGSGHDKKGVLATLDHIYHTTGKKVKLLISDGLSQWSWNGQNEINATINNSFIAKEVAKEAYSGEGVAHIALIHISGDIKRWYRATGDYVRGGKKVLANLDAYFCTSRLIDPSTNQMVNEDDVAFLQDKFYLRYVDKRSRTGTINKIINVLPNLELKTEVCDPNMYELKISKQSY